MSKNNKERKVNDEIINIGAQIVTKRGYFGTVVGKTYWADPQMIYVTLHGCTYSDEHWYDKVPRSDVRLATKKDIKAWTRIVEGIPKKK